MSIFGKNNFEEMYVFAKCYFEEMSFSHVITVHVHAWYKWLVVHAWNKGEYHCFPIQILHKCIVCARNISWLIVLWTGIFFRWAGVYIHLLVNIKECLYMIKAHGHTCKRHIHLYFLLSDQYLLYVWKGSTRFSAKVCSIDVLRVSRVWAAEFMLKNVKRCM